MEILSSVKNPKIKQLLALDKAKERRQQGIFKIEGLREVLLAVESGVECSSYYYNPKHWDEDSLNQKQLDWPGAWIPVAQHVFERISYRGNVKNVVAVAQIPKKRSLNELKSGKILVVEAIEKPGNLGAILRTADAAGMDAIIMANPLVEITNPNAIRASLGAIFTIPIYLESSESCLKHLKDNQFTIYTTFIEQSTSYREVAFESNAAIVVGSEARGVSDVWKDACCQNITIPMQGKVNSMNVSVAAAILMYELCNV